MISIQAVCTPTRRSLILLQSDLAAVAYLGGPVGDAPLGSRRTFACCPKGNVQRAVFLPFVNCCIAQMKEIPVKQRHHVTEDGASALAAVLATPVSRDATV